MERALLTRWLLEEDEEALVPLWQEADAVRRLDELSNHCVRLCHYCGIRADALHHRADSLHRSRGGHRARVGAGLCAVDADQGPSTLTLKKLS